MFIRIKRIKGMEYAYLVKNEWKRGRAVQKVKKYLGKVLTVHDKPKPELPKNISPNQVLNTLIKKELESADVDIDFKKRSVRKEGAKVVVSLNGGFFCDRTFRELYRAVHERHEVTPGERLAKAFSDAGIRVSEPDFVMLYKGYHK